MQERVFSRLVKPIDAGGNQGFGRHQKGQLVDDDGANVSRMKAPDPKAVPAFSDSAEIVVQKTTTTEPAMTNDRWLARAVFGLVLGWFSISLVCLAWQSLRFRWQMRHVAQAAPSHRKLLDSICESRGIKHRVQLLKSDRFEAPVAYGLFQPTIIIPAQVEQRLNRDDLAALLSHELAHLVRGDIWWLVIGRVLTTCFAF